MIVVVVMRVTAGTLVLLVLRLRFARNEIFGQGANRIQSRPVSRIQQILERRQNVFAELGLPDRGKPPVCP